MNILRRFIGNSPTDEIALIASGKLFLTRLPNSPKGAFECLYNDAFACIKQTTTPFYYQLCIIRAYQEGEASGNNENDFDDSDDDYDQFDNTHNSSSANEADAKDEWTFLISEELKIYNYTKSATGSKTIVWNDINGDPGDKFEFVIDEEVKPTDVDNFILALYKCLYEQKYQRSSAGIHSLDDLKEFFNNPTLEAYPFEGLESLQKPKEDLDEEFHDALEDPKRSSSPYQKQPRKIPVKNSAIAALAADPKLKPAKKEQSVVSTSSKDETTPLNIFSVSGATLFFLDPIAAGYKIRDTDCTVSVLEEEPYLFRLVVKGDSTVVDTIIDSRINPTLDFAHNNFTFTELSRESANSWVLKYGKEQDLKDFQRVLMQCLWETSSLRKWGKANTSQADEDYLTDTLMDMNIDDSEDETTESGSESEDEEEATEKAIKQGMGLKLKDKAQRLFVDSDDEFDDNEEEKAYNQKFLKDSKKNSGLAVGYANDRSYVSRGDKLGVFKHDDDNISYQTTIANIKGLDGTTFSPKDLMLHQQDQYMIISNPDKHDRLYKMDLNRGKVIEEWNVGEVNSFAPTQKLAQLSNEQTVVATSSKSLFKVDPRLSGSQKVEDSEMTYKTGKLKNIATTLNGNVVVGSETGELRLYDKFGMRAKTLLPSTGQGTSDIDVSKDGQWLLTTFETYLSLINTVIGEGNKNAGANAFMKPFDADKKPKPIRLSLKPEHIATIVKETKKPFKLTKAFFNTGISGKEDSIVTSSGPYIITWPLKELLKGARPQDCYRAKKYDQDVVADQFRFNTSSNVIVAYQDNVAMEKKRNLRKMPKHRLP